MDFRPGATRYLTSQMGCADQLDREERELAEAAERGDAVSYYEAAERDGEAPGRWRGRGAELLGFTNGEAVSTDDVKTVLGEARDPGTGERLGQKPKGYLSRQEKLKEWLDANPTATAEDRLSQWNTICDQEQRNAVAFYDITFSCEKGISVYHAALQQSGQHELADAVLQAHRTAVRQAMTQLETRETWTRVGGHRRLADGTSTGRFERTDNVVSVEFDHSTSRSEDPHMHTHVAVLNRVHCEDGTWRAIHGAAWKKIKASISATYERALAEEIERTTPARFVARENGLGRDIVGISDEILQESSKRSAEVEAAQDEVEQQFRQREGRAPTARERAQLHRRASTESRSRKSHRSPDQQIQDWADVVDVDEITQDVAAAGRDIDWYGRPDDDAMPDPADRSAVIRSAVAEVQARAATWLPGELRAELERQLPVQIPGVEDSATYIDHLVHEALTRVYGIVDISRPEPLPPPGWWRNAEGRPRWRDPAAGRYTTHGQLTAERDLVVTARQSRGDALAAAQLRDAEAQLRQRGLSEDQLEAVLGVLGSPRAAEALVSAAGTGKSFTMGQLAGQWEQRTGGRVLGLATSQIATEVLEADGLDAINTTRFLNAYEPDAETGRPRARLGHRDMLVVDESNMSSTAELSRIQRIAAAAGAKLLYTGDPRQLQAVGAGGALGLIARENGAHELEQVHRFIYDWEKDASLRLREGDLDVVDVYAEKGRIDSGDAAEMRRRAVLNYVHDTQLRGKTSVLVTDSNQAAASVSAEVQNRLMRIGRVGRQVVDRLSDGNAAHAGDLVQARRNDRTVRTSGSLSQVTNRERYRVVSVDRHGSLLVRSEDGEGQAWLPPEYVEEHLTLGYSGTAHAVEGLSVDTGHALTAGYVALTRGKENNQAYLETYEAADHHGPETDQSPREVFRARLQQNTEEVTAVEYRRQQVEQAEHMSHLVGIWDYTGREVDDYRHGDLLLGSLGADLADQIQMESGAPTLYETLREAEAYGHDVSQLLTTAVDERSISGVDDLAATLAWRVDRHISRETSGHGWSERTSQLPGPLGEFRQELGELMDAREREIGRRAVQEQPDWAIEALGAPPEDGDQEQRSEWERRAAAIGSWRETALLDESSTAVGPRPSGWLDRLLWTRASRAARLDYEHLDYATADESQLRSWISEAERCTAWAPEYVADELGTARRLQQRQESEAALARAAAEQDGLSPDERVEQQHAADRAERLRDRMAARAQQLEDLQQTRRDWLQQTAGVRHRATEARQELTRRGMVEPEPEQPVEQASLFAEERLIWRPDLEPVAADEVREAATQRAAEEATQRLQEQIHEPELERDLDDDQHEQEITGAVEQDQDQQQAELFDADELMAANPGALAAAERVRVSEEELEEAPHRPLVASESLRQAQAKAQHAQALLQRHQAQQATEELALEAEAQQQWQAEQSVTAEAGRDEQQLSL